MLVKIKADQTLYCSVYFSYLKPIKEYMLHLHLEQDGWYSNFQNFLNLVPCLILVKN